ncbi:MAG: transcriptional repressor [Saprospiraceae bacterium]|nr:transcriptional repressor [Saprospiraceae bacterium]
MNQETKINQLLKKRKLKKTDARVELLELLMNYQTAIPFSIIQKELSSTDRITLYRTLKTLLNKGVIHKALYNEKDTYYALCGNSCSNISHAHNHIHFKCNKCMQVSCQDLEKEIYVSIEGFKIDQINITASGICQQCI